METSKMYRAQSKLITAFIGHPEANLVMTPPTTPHNAFRTASLEGGVDVRFTSNLYIILQHVRALQLWTISF